jgi:hypothetical protein
MKRSFSVLATACHVLLLASCGPSEQEKNAQEKADIDFCRSVYQAITPDNKRCGKYLSLLTKEIQNAKESEKKAKDRISFYRSLNIADKCKSLIGQLMGRGKESMISIYPSGGDVTMAMVGYTRDDGTLWLYECKTDGKTLVWRGFNIPGNGEGPGRWREEDRISINP